jgi:hypothetical protein
MSYLDLDRRLIATIDGFSPLGQRRIVRVIYDSDMREFGIEIADNGKPRESLDFTTRNRSEAMAYARNQISTPVPSTIAPDCPPMAKAESRISGASLTYEALRGLSPRDLAHIALHSPRWRDRLNAAEMLYVRVHENAEGINLEDRVALARSIA